MLRRSGIAMVAFFLLASVAWAQDNTYEISLGGSAVFSKQSTGNGTVLTPTNSAAVLVTGRYRFTEHSSVELNYSHTSNSQIYFSPPLTYRIQGTIAEYSGAYVFSFHQTPRVEPFVFAGEFQMLRSLGRGGRCSRSSLRVGLRNAAAVSRERQRAADDGACRRQT